MNTVWVKKSTTKRLFVAIPLPNDWRNTLQGAQQELKRTRITGNVPTRWTDANNFHITVGFIGSVSEKDIFGTTEALHTISGSVRQFELSFKRFEIATSREPKMIWARFANAHEFQKIVRLCKKTLHVQNGHAVIPHVTIARLKGEADHVGKILIPTQVPDVLPVTSLVLYESKTLPTGSVYTTLATFRLR